MRHLKREDFGQAIADHEHGAGKPKEEANPGVEGAVLRARVLAEVGEDGPKDAASHGEDEYQAVVNPVHGCVAGFAGVPVGRDSGEMEEVLADELAEMIEGPVELVLDPATDDWEDIQKGSVRADNDEAGEVEERDAEGKADCRTPGRGRSRGGFRRGQFAGSGDTLKLHRDLAGGRFWMLDDFESR